MKNFQQKKKNKHFWYSKPVLFILGIIVLIFAYNVFGLIGKMQETIKNRQNAEQKLENLQKEKEKLISDINKLKTDKGVEESIREKFGLAKEGEGMVVVVDDKTPALVENEQKPTGGFFSFFKNLFK